MIYKKLLHYRKAVINTDGKQIETRIVYGDFPLGTERTQCAFPKLLLTIRARPTGPLPFVRTAPGLSVLTSI